MKFKIVDKEKLENELCDLLSNYLLEEDKILYSITTNLKQDIKNNLIKILECLLRK